MSKMPQLTTAEWELLEKFIATRMQHVTISNASQKAHKAIIDLKKDQNHILLKDSVRINYEFEFTIKEMLTELQRAVRKEG